VTATQPASGAATADPPADIPAEKAVLGAILLSPDVARGLLPQLRAEQFYRPAHGEVLGVMQHLHTRGEPIDPLIVHAELRRRGRVQFGERNAAVVLHDLLAATPTVANAGYYAGIVAETAARRRAIEAGVRLVQLAGPGHGDLDQLMSDAVRELACLRAAVDRHHALVPSTRDQPARPAADRPLRAVGDPDVGR
jgi:replicative DNA helicase